MRRLAWLAIAGTLVACEEAPHAPRIPDTPPLAAARQPAGPTATPITYAPEAGPIAHEVVLGDDEVSAPLPIGFTFVFFGNSYTEFAISSNGFITFDPSVHSGCCSGHPIPEDDGVNNLIAIAWTDLFPPGGGRIAHETRGEAPNRRLIVSFEELPWWPEFGVHRVTAQAILYEGSNVVEIHTTFQSAGHIYTQGVENADGTLAAFLLGRVAADFGLSEDAVRFTTDVGRGRGGGRGPQGRGAVVASATGAGHFTFEGELRTFSFTARRFADGSVSGEWQRNTRSRDAKAHGTVTCLNVVGRQAWIGGDTRWSDTSPAGEVGWRVEDRGQGRNSPPDRISTQWPDLGTGWAQFYCDEQWDSPEWYLVEHGNIQVRRRGNAGF